ncbi:hypothetical protein SAMN04487965_0272 [Microbulbifer donghaiensis]|uniref:DUF2092 domain-containing protein n=1 Tax=Microbulbifer donghaiensis TaxID=494016 RepID=A0A1M4UX91_9GAMM|nr:DUF2092 domain-containing protein [Microbulbifer donghaiensis]SHE61336.1 hypothetical protein SAMN04487965_0272 [Microbulbifer donghaiensis]
MIVVRPAWVLLFILVVAGAFVIAPASAQPPDKTPQSTAEKSEPAVDPDSVTALSRMGKYLASLKTLAFDADISTDVVLDNQQKLLIGGVVRYLAVHPGKLRVELVTDSMKRHFFHNGRKFTMVAPEEGYFAELEASIPTREFLATAAREYGVEMPLADLVEWGHAQDSWKDIREGFLVGKPKVNGEETEHWAFRSPDLDWEIWIKSGDKPLPLRISTVNTRDPAKPRFEATLKWSEAKVAKDEMFTPALPKETQRIEFKKIAPKKEGKQ